MRFVRGDTRDHIISCKNDHGASYRRYGVLHWWCRLKINVLRDFRQRSIFDFCNIIGHFRKSAFVVARSALLPIVLQKSKVAAVQIFGENPKRQEVDDSYSLSRATEVAREFGARR